MTARNTDIGALINAGQSAGTQLFRVADTTRLRIYVQVPENYTPAITPELKAELHFTEYPARSFTAKLEHTAHALDPTTRTLLVELVVDNAKGELMPGGYRRRTSFSCRRTSKLSWRRPVTSLRPTSPS